MFARLSCRIAENIMQTVKNTLSSRLWRVGIYIRLSKEDPARDESESIANQRAILRDYLAGLQDGDQYQIIQEYIDDGLSGTTDDERVQFQQMLNDIRQGRINCVIVKDLARSFRNYSDQGYYLDDWFPRHQVRFISLFHQTLDSFRQPNQMRNIAVPIQGVLNESHCAETSDKVREVLDMKRRKGEYIGAFAPFGYRKNPQNKNALVIDPDAAMVVQDIFRKFLSGMSKTAIAHTLNQYALPCPTVYKQQCLGLHYYNPHAAMQKTYQWSAATIGHILQNQVYCGDMVQGRFRIKSYKLHIQESVPKEDWYVVPHTHEAIISREMFEKAAHLLKQTVRTAPARKTVYLFSGLLQCACCGKLMTRTTAKNYVYYTCRMAKNHAGKNTTIRADKLEQAVLSALRQQIASVPVILPHIRLNPQSDPLLARQKDALCRVVRYKQSLYQDWKDGSISRADYLYLKTDYERQIHTLQQGIAVLEKQSTPPENTFQKAFRQAGNLPYLTREALTTLIDHIAVYPGGKIQIFCRFCLNP